MKISLANATLFITVQEVVVMMPQHQMQLRAHIDDISLFENQSLLVANGGAVAWSVSVDTQENLLAISKFAGIEIV